MRLFALVMFAVFVLHTPVFANDKVCEGVDEFFIKKHINIPTLQIEGKREAYSLCEVVISIEGNYMTFYVSKENDFLILGELFSSGVHISRESILKYKQKEFLSSKEEIEKAVAFSYKPENVKDVLYFFTDPNCPYCSRAKPEVKKIADNKGFEIRVIFFPINSVSRDKAVKGICGKMTYQDYLDDKYSGSDCKEGQEKIEASMRVGKKLKLGGVPTFITSKGLIFEGFNIEGLNSL